MTRRKSIPKYRRHKSGQARVELNGVTHYLGRYDSPESRQHYDQLIQEWLAKGRAISSPRKEVDPRDEISTAEVIEHYMHHCQSYYGPVEDKRSETYNVTLAMRVVNKLYGDDLAGQFGPLKLQTVRQAFVDQGVCRYTANKYTDRVKRMFKWASSQELVRPEVYHGLATVGGLRKGRSDARESRGVAPADAAVVDATLAQLGPVVGDMVTVAMLTGMRPAEVCLMRPCDIDTTVDPWVYRPQRHKMQYADRSREIHIGPRCQLVLRPYLLRMPNAYCFNPAEAANGECGDHYDTASFRRAIHRAADRANVERWSPNRLRHLRATTIRKEHGLEAAQVALGHARADVTQVYAERDRRLAAEVARQTG